jgi:two-component system sensor histidine kinase TctE
MKLLLVEDNASMQATLQRALERHGTQVLTCGDGLRALALWQASLSDAVLLDLSLPGRDGLQVLSDARAAGLTTPGIILTARGTVGDRIIGLNTGADDDLPKPVDLDKLEARLRALVRRASNAGDPLQTHATHAAAWCDLCVASDSGAATFEGAVLDLAPRELSLLRALLARPGQAAAKERLFDLVFAGAHEVQLEAIEVAATTCAKKWRPPACSWSRCAVWAIGSKTMPDIGEAAPSASERKPVSLRRTLLLGSLPPPGLFVLVNTVVLYRRALAAADTAYDRTLLATAKSLSEPLQVVGPADAPRLQATLLYSALEAFKADNRSRLYHRISGFAGEMVSGFEDLPAVPTTRPQQQVYAALVHFYDDIDQGEPVRMAVLLQPVAGPTGSGMATIQVAETLRPRETLARQILVDTLWRQAALVVMIVLVVVLVVQRATRPVRDLSRSLRSRSDNDLSPLPHAGAPRELLPLVDATNQHMARLSQLLDQQKRFVRDTSHQLRTPLAVLKTQLQSVQRGDVAPQQVFAELAHTVRQATELAHQMLALAKVEQLRQDTEAPVNDWAEVVRSVALDLAPLIAERALDFAITTQNAPVRSHVWALRELSRNRLHNAIKHPPPGGSLTVTVHRARCPGHAVRERRRARHIQRAAPAPVSAVCHRVRPGPHRQRGLGLGDLPRHRAIAGRTHHPRQPRARRRGARVQRPMTTAQEALFQPQTPDFHARKCSHPDA